MTGAPRAPRRPAPSVAEGPPTHATARQHLDSIARGGTLNLAGALVSAVSGFALTVLVTNVVAGPDAGAFFTATSMIVILAGLGGLGTEAGLGRFAFMLAENGRAADLRTCIRVAAWPVATVSVVLAVLLYVARGALAEAVSLGPRGPAMIVALACALPAVTAAAFFLAASRATGRMRPTVLIDKVGRSLAQPVGVLLVTVLGGGLLGITIAWAVPYGVAAALAVWAYRHSRLWRDGGTSGPRRPWRAVASEFWSFTWARGLAQFAQVAIQRADIVIVAALLGATPAAIYTAATRFVTLGQFGTQAIQQVLQPQFSQLVARNDLVSLSAVFKTAAAWAASIGWPVYVIVGCCAGTYLDLFGPEYRDDGRFVVVIMSAAMIFAVATGPVDTLLLMSGRSRQSLMNAVLALAVDIVLCFVLVPRLGISGAAIAWLGAVVARTSLGLVQVRRATGITPSSTGIVAVAAANAVCFAAPLLVGTLVFGAGPVVQLLILLAGGVAYAGCLFWARGPLALGGFVRALRRRT